MHGGFIMDPNERCACGCGRHADLYYTKGTQALAVATWCPRFKAADLDAKGWRVLVPMASVNA